MSGLSTLWPRGSGSAREPRLANGGDVMRAAKKASATKKTKQSKSVSLASLIKAPRMKK